MTQATNEFEISRWQTLLSDLDGLFLVSCVNNGSVLTLTVEDRGNERFEVVFENPVPYRMVDEGHLQNYWGASDRGRSWTFKVENPTWIRDLYLMDVYLPGAECFVVATYDTCLEVLCKEQPVIRAL